MRHVVIVGAGMAGHRVAEEIRARRPGWRITLVGAEPHRPYNRVLLTNLLAGRATEDSVELPRQDEGTAVVTGVRVTAVDRAARTVTTDDGRVTGYDTLVLATGGVAWLPPVKGLVGDSGRRHPGTAAFRTLADCHRILGLAEAAVASAPSGRSPRALVLGGGLLGVEAARGLAQRGLEVRVLHAADRLMERQLDAAAGRVLGQALDRLGIAVELGAAVTEVTAEDGRLTGVKCADGRHIAGDLLVVSCGAQPDTRLAEAAGLPVGRGVVVDDRMRTADPHVYAVGDCAEHRGTVHGLVAPAWEQAAVAAQAITQDPRGVPYRGSRIVTRLKAAGIDLTAMGETQLTENDAYSADEGAPPEVVRFLDTRRGTYQKLILRENRVTGAILLGGSTGATAGAGTVTGLFDRQAEAPLDRRLLLFPEFPEPGGAAAGVAPGAAGLPGDAVVCQCNAVTKDAITRCRRAGAGDVAAVAARTRATTGCGSCRPLVEELLARPADPAVPSAEVHGHTHREEP
ncbi:FAD-dependent oxidoreductase [Streptomyces sp. MN13]